MDWVLVILTFYSPNVELKITEIEFETSRECMATMELYEKEFEKADENFTYTMRCERRRKQ